LNVIANCSVTVVPERTADEATALRTHCEFSSAGPAPRTPLSGVAVERDIGIGYIVENQATGIVIELQGPTLCGYLPVEVPDPDFAQLCDWCDLRKN
jgi:hypothetical protein